LTNADNSYDALEGRTKSLWKTAYVPCLMGIRSRCTSCNNMFWKNFLLCEELL